jgi:hypothetical protein
MGESIRITVIATGFERAGMPRRFLEQRKPKSIQKKQTQSTDEPEVVMAEVGAEFQPRAFNTEDLDIPTFLRNRIR